MPVFHITLHAYRSWNADHPRGFIRKDRKGIQSPNPKLARARDRFAKHAPVSFSPEDCEFLVEAARIAARHCSYTLYGTTATRTHLHIAVGASKTLDADEAQAALKSGVGYLLSKRAGKTGLRWFSKAGAPEQVKDRAHLRYLLEEYFPDHHAPIWIADIRWN
jgi:hypothetical protein